MSGCEYFYVMRDGVWYVSEGAEWKFLAEALAEHDIEQAEQV
jgi:hypothetical protein